MPDPTPIQTDDIHATIDPATPLDTPIAALIQDARDNDMGFAYRVAAELKDGVKEIVHRVEKVLPPFDDTEGPAAYRMHTIEDADSLIAFAKKYSSSEKGLILYNDTGICLTLDELKEKGSRELIQLKFAYSVEWHAWDKVLSGHNGVEHKPLLTHLLMNQHTLLDVTMLERTRRIKATFTANLESDLQLNEETVGVAFKATAGNEIVQFPREFEISVPVLDLDVDEPRAWQKVPVRVEVQLPEQPNQPVRFQLLAPTLNGVRRNRINAEVRVIREALPEWCVVRGTPNFAERSVPGRKT